MITDTEIIKCLIKETVCNVFEKSGGNLKLQEKDIYEILIEAAPENTSLIKFDGNFPQPDKIFDCEKGFKGDKGLCKRADYILISEKEESIFLIEVTSGSSKGDDDITCQLRGAECFVEYLKSNWKNILGQGYFS